MTRKKRDKKIYQNICITFYIDNILKTIKSLETSGFLILNFPNVPKVFNKDINIYTERNSLTLFFNLHLQLLSLAAERSFPSSLRHVSAILTTLLLLKYLIRALNINRMWLISIYQSQLYNQSSYTSITLFEHDDPSLGKKVISWSPNKLYTLNIILWEHWFCRSCRRFQCP